MKQVQAASLYKLNLKVVNNIRKLNPVTFENRIIYHNQVGFIPSVQGWFSLQKTMSVIWHLLITSTHAEAFDKIQYPS